MFCFKRTQAGLAYLAIEIDRPNGDAMPVANGNVAIAAAKQPADRLRVGGRGIEAALDGRLLGARQTWENGKTVSRIGERRIEDGHDAVVRIHGGMSRPSSGWSGSSASSISISCGDVVHKLRGVAAAGHENTVKLARDLDIKPDQLVRKAANVGSPFALPLLLLLTRSRSLLSA